MPTVEQPRIGFVGAGRHSSLNLYLAFATRGIPLAGVAERNPARVADCVRAGVAVFAEKPLGSTEAKAQQVASIAADAGVPVMLGFMKRFAPAYTQLTTLIGEGTEQGPVISYACEFGFVAWKPDFTPVEFITQAVIHLIDLMQVHHENGIIGSLNFVSATAWSRETEELSVTCTNGVVRVTNLARIQVLTGAVSGDTAAPGEALGERSVVYDASNAPASGGLKDLHLRGYIGEMKHFIGVLQRTEELSPSAADNVRTMALCDRILAAIG